MLKKASFNLKRRLNLDFSENDIEKLATEYVKNRMGIPGVQRKLSLGLFKKQIWAYPCFTVDYYWVLRGRIYFETPFPRLSQYA